MDRIIRFPVLRNCSRYVVCKSLSASRNSPRADASFAHPPCQAAGRIMLQLRICPFSPGHHRHPARRQQHLAVLQAGGHEGPEIRFGKRSDKSQDGIIPRILPHPGQHPQQCNPGKGIQFCQPEIQRLSVRRDGDGFNNFTHWTPHSFSLDMI